MLSVAGLWDEWNDAETDEAVKSCTIIVTAANALTRPSGAAGTELLKPAPEDALRAWPVSRRVNRGGNDADPTLIDAVQ